MGALTYQEMWTEHERERCLRNGTRHKTRRRIKSGLITPTPCEACGREGEVQAHHKDYQSPYSVAFLCPQCHGQAHGLLTKTPEQVDAALTKFRRERLLWLWVIANVPSFHGMSLED